MDGVVEDEVGTIVDGVDCDAAVGESDPGYSNVTNPLRLSELPPCIHDVKMALVVLYEPPPPPPPYLFCHINDAPTQTQCNNKIQLKINVPKNI